ncbi:uncharacterized protein DSM5745_00807 [Aspergillus mulundensis]|uniref:Rhodopsin domain-containing protein n=1 Tax=Aspergillus mulundensis TaxID=1810919 RepID=A0A3D8T4K9_9EURO|nr:Uncharacterized protein DSM5745_00807 [Aspergillus mulundensis]RDW93485.1 Uncharacterized protein DSM5745_00807 [Aspergillus mulundensis]
MAYDPTGCAVAAICFLVAAWAFTGVRLYVRVTMRKGPFIDDTLAVISLITFTVYTIIFAWTQLKGYIPLAITPSPAYGRAGLKYYFICDIFYSVGTYIMKLSFTCTLLTLTQTRAQFLVLSVVMVAGGIITAAACIHAALFCKPTSYHWNRFANPLAEGHCDAFWSRMTATMVQSVWIMIADVVLGLVVPFMLLHRATMYYKTKMSIRVLLGLGSIASVTTVIRLVYLSIAAADPTITYAIVPMAFWSLIEHGVSILCASMTTWKPLFVKLGIVDARDDHGPVHVGFNTADREAFGTQSTTLNNGSEGQMAESDSGKSGWKKSFVRLFPDRKRSENGSGGSGRVEVGIREALGGSGGA